MSGTTSSKKAPVLGNSGNRAMPWMFRAAKPKAKAETKPKAGSQKGSSKTEAKEEAISVADSFFDPDAPCTMGTFMLAQELSARTWRYMQTDADLRRRILSGGKVTGKRKRTVKAEYEPSKASSTFLMWSSSAEGKAFATRKERAAAWEKLKAANDPVYQQYTELYNELKTKFATIRKAYETMYAAKTATEESKAAYIKLYEQWCLERKAGLPVEDEEDDEEDEEEDDEEPPAKRARTQAPSSAPVAAGAGVPSGSQEF